MEHGLKLITVKGYLEYSYSLTAKYQTGARWNLKQKQELISTLIEGSYVLPFLVDKIRNEVIDGQQRTRAIIEFMDGTFSLPNKLHYFELSKKEKDSFLGYKLLLVDFEGTEEEISLLFRRVNSGTPLNHAEKRNAQCTKFSSAINLIANEHPLFKGSIKCSNKINHRHVYDELVASFIMLETNGIESFSPKKLELFYKTNAKGINEGIAKRVTKVLDYMYSTCKINIQTINNSTAIQMYLFISKLVKSENYIPPSEFSEFYFLESASWRADDVAYRNAQNGGVKLAPSMKVRFDKILNSYLKHFDPDFEEVNKMCYAKDAGRIIKVLSKVHNKRKQA